MLMYARIAFFCRICGEIKRLESTHLVGTLSSVYPHVHTTRFLSVRVLAGRRLAGHQASVRWNTSLQVWLARVVFKFVPIFYFRRRAKPMSLDCCDFVPRMTKKTTTALIYQLSSYVRTSSRPSSVV